VHDIGPNIMGTWCCKWPAVVVLALILAGGLAHAGSCSRCESSQVCTLVLPVVNARRDDGSPCGFDDLLPVVNSTSWRVDMRRGCWTFTTTCEPRDGGGGRRSASDDASPPCASNASRALFDWHVRTDGRLDVLEARRADAASWARARAAGAACREDAVPFASDRSIESCFAGALAREPDGSAVGLGAEGWARMLGCRLAGMPAVVREACASRLCR
jgi:hypothetical protein